MLSPQAGEGEEACGGQEADGKKLARAVELQFGADRACGPEKGDTQQHPWGPGLPWVWAPCACPRFSLPFYPC